MPKKNSFSDLSAVAILTLTIFVVSSSQSELDETVHVAANSNRETCNLIEAKVQEVKTAFENGKGDLYQTEESTVNIDKKIDTVQKSLDGIIKTTEKCLDRVDKGMREVLNAAEESEEAKVEVTEKVKEEFNEYLEKIQRKSEKMKENLDKESDARE